MTMITIPASHLFSWSFKAAPASRRGNNGTNQDQEKRDSTRSLLVTPGAYYRKIPGEQLTALFG
ncbi:hypothetical protein C7423_11376 [Pantoea ananatis]|nr:hypothetical protein C7426_1312 [Pantoea ananatis]REC89205.1 hypothetical protein C7423_11376 [Pantoea ananatis]SFY14580.1 hypothetical protein SAMN03097714_4597 [Pantoea ananatis]